MVNAGGTGRPGDRDARRAFRARARDAAFRCALQSALHRGVAHGRHRAREDAARQAPRRATRRSRCCSRTIQDPGNVGTLLRSAAAAGAGHVHALRAAAPSRGRRRCCAPAMGAHFALEIVEERRPRRRGFSAYRGHLGRARRRARPQSLYDLDLAKPCALLVGNEGAGLSPALESAATVRAKIPMPGRVESLNAGTAGSIALFECVRQKVSRGKTGNHRWTQMNTDGHQSLMVSCP